MLNTPSASQVERSVDNATIESWIAALLKLAEEQEETAQAQDAAISPSREIKCPLPKVAEGPWRSLGGYFDYSLWADRERFLELDRAIAAGQDLGEQEADQTFEMV